MIQPWVDDCLSYISPRCLSIHEKGNPRHGSHFPLCSFVRTFNGDFYSKPCTNINTALREDEFILTFTENAHETKHISIYGLLDAFITHFPGRKVFVSPSDVRKSSHFSEPFTAKPALTVFTRSLGPFSRTQKSIGIKGICKTWHSRNWGNDFRWVLMKIHNTCN